ncbi:MAG: hypothetical protein KGZ60_01820 [Truepera sp.]|nr:hypothetical protein [Truepera sp.]
MFGWAKRKLEAASVNAQRDDINRFIAGLRGADDEEIGTMLVVANGIRINLLRLGAIPVAALDFSIPRDADTQMKCDMCPITLSSSIKQFQRDNQRSDAFGVMVWLHSVRALNAPELRSLGREMWGELARGFRYADEAYQDIREIAGDRLPPDLQRELTFIPRGLEPRA